MHERFNLIGELSNFLFRLQQVRGNTEPVQKEVWRAIDEEISREQDERRSILARPIICPNEQRKTNNQP